METYVKSSVEGRLISLETTTFEDAKKVAIGTGITKTPYSWTNSLNGFKNPNWKAQVKKRQIATTPVAGVSRSVGGRKLEAEVHHLHRIPLAGNPKLRSHFISGYACPHFSGFADAIYSDPAVAGRAATGFRKKLGSLRREIDGGVFLGELQETLRLIKNPAKALRHGIDDYITALKKRRRRSARQNAKTLADTWLEYSFGWRPLMADIEKGLEVLAFRKSRELFCDEYVMVTFRARSVRQTLNQYTNFSPTGCRVHFWNNRVRTEEHSVRFKGVMKIEVPPQNRIDSTVLGTSWGDFFPTAWELLPWSFLIDYFTNLGDVIQAWSTGLAGLTWVQKTDRKTNIHLIEFGLNEALTKATYGSDGGAGGTEIKFGGAKQDGWLEHVDKRFNREPGGLEYPQIQFELPDFGTKWINMAALLGTRTSTSRASYY